ncbi:hypothetical protein [uncultured Clostridium sp.]|uniref:hypothetical protein n=1 Tax=uncultured Clostridium sp. TaxID=59620 RepID=UPI002628E898|nr:hypothetical protein [uncultured Clostridium sp.]
MNKKIKRSLVSLLLFLGVFGATAFANPLKETSFVGEVVKIQKCEETKETKLLVCGYLKGCEITKTQMIIVCNKDTDVKDTCNKKIKDLEVKEGDMICVTLDKKMTKSIPPQAVAKKLFVSKGAENKCKKEDSVKKEAPVKKEDSKSKETLNGENEVKKETPKSKKTSKDESGVKKEGLKSKETSKDEGEVKKEAEKTTETKVEKKEKTEEKSKLK